MPGFTSHYIIGRKGFEDLSECGLKTIIGRHLSVFQLGVQGPDIFFYYVFMQLHKKAYRIGTIMHEKQVNVFFRSMLDHLKEIREPHAFEIAAAYTAGYISHYISDSIMHPYVYARIGYEPSLKGKALRQTHSRHCQLENDIDAILLLRYNNKLPSDFDQAETFSLTKEERKTLSDFLASSITRAYFSRKEEDEPTHTITRGVVARSIVAMRIGCKTLSDPKERKRRAIHRLERIFGAQPLASNKLVTDRISDIRYALNTVHEPWYNPWDRRIVSEKSIPELFLQIVRKTNLCFSLLGAYIDDLSSLRGFSEITNPDVPGEKLRQRKLKKQIMEERRALLKALGNASFHSGLEAE